MASNRKLRSGGSTSDQALDSTKRYKYNSSGSLVEIDGSSVTESDDDIVFSGSKSNLRRIADLEKNVSILAAKALTSDGSSGASVTLADKAKQWATSRTLSLTGAVTGSASVDGSGNVSLATTATSDPVITLTGAVTGSGTMTNLGSVSIATTATADPTITLAGDATGSVTLTNLGNGTLTVAVVDDSHNHIISNVDGLQAALDAKLSTASYAASNAFTGVTVSNDTLTFTRADGSTSVSVTTSDANTNTYVTGASFNTADGVLTLTRNSGAVTVDLDGRFTDNAYADTMNQHVRTTDTVTFGAVRATGEVTAYYSDGRLKTNLQKIDGALDKVMALNGYTYDSNEVAESLGLPKHMDQIGLLAEEVQAVLPELVTDSALEGYKTIRYDKVVSVLVNAVKEQQAQIEELKALVKKTLH